jgi:ferredoxin--NADP+ reductase
VNGLIKVEKYKILQLRRLTTNTIVIKTERPLIKIKAGQCFNIGFEGMGVNREYSMYSSSNSPYLEFLIRVVPKGHVSSRLSQLQAGDYVEINGPYGNFCVPDEPEKFEYLFIGTGTGVAPFHSFVKSYPDLNYKVIHGIRYSDEAYDSHIFLKNKYIACISKNNLNEPMRVTDYIKKNIPNKKTKIFLCGNKGMIIDVVQILLDNEISGDQITTEVFF